MKSTKPVTTREPDKATKPKKKRSLDYSTLKPFLEKVPQPSGEKTFIRAKVILVFDGRTNDQYNRARLPKP